MVSSHGEKTGEIMEQFSCQEGDFAFIPIPKIQGFEINSRLHRLFTLVFVLHPSKITSKLLNVKCYSKSQKPSKEECDRDFLWNVHHSVQSFHLLDT